MTKQPIYKATSSEKMKARLERRRREQELEELVHTQIVDRINTLRAALQVDYDDRYSRAYPRAPYELRDTASGLWVGIEVTGKAQAMRCKFCGKQVAAWKGTPNKAKRTRSGVHQPKEMRNAAPHFEPCALAWLHTQLCLWSTRMMDDGKATFVDKWRREHMVPPDSQRSHHWNEIPRGMEKVFDNLPQPPSSPFAQELEVLLVTLSQIWSH